MMHKKTFLSTVAALVILATIACSQAPPAQEETATLPLIKEATPTQIEMAALSQRVEVNRWGFNKSPGEFRLEVEKGEEVEITFVYGDKDLPENNPHIISVPDYGITTDILDWDNPEVIVRFTATETGEVAFLCIAPGCIGHHNLHTIT